MGWSSSSRKPAHMSENVKQSKTGSQRIRREKARWFNKTIGAIPASLASAFDGIPGNIVPLDPSQLTPEERAPAHVVKYGEVPIFNDAALENIRAKSSNDKRNERDHQIATLKLKYREIWGKRSEAKRIAALETEDGNPLSERTVQRYFKLSP